MTTQLTERHIVAINYLLVTILAYFAALAANDILAPRPRPEDSFARTVARSMTHVPAHSRSDYQAIVERDIFNLTPPPAPPPPPVVEELHLTLVGVSRMSNGKPFAIIQDERGQQAVYRVGETIPNSGKLVAVESDRAIIEHQGRNMSIELPKDVLSDSPAIRRLRIGEQPNDIEQSNEPEPDNSIDSSTDASADEPEPTQEPPDDSD